MMSELHLLGPPCILKGDGQRVSVRGHKAWGLLAYLALRSSAASRSHLAALLFADAEDPLAALRWNLCELRRALGDGTLRGDPLVLPREVLSGVDLDVLAQGRWQEGLGLPGLGGELLEGQHFSGCAAFQVWLDGQRRHAGALTSALLREASLAKLAAGNASDAVAVARRLLVLDPLDENAHVLLVRCLGAAGDGIEAARQAAACRKLLQQELGVTPGAALDEALATATAMPTHAAVAGRGAVRALLEAGEAALRAGAVDAGLQCLRRAIADADALCDPLLRKRARVALGGALVHSARGRDEEGAAALHESLGIAHDAGADIDAAACRELGYVEFLAGRYERALAWLTRADPLAGADPAERARIATVRGAVLSDQGHYRAALTQLHRAADLARQVGELRQSLYADSMIGRVLLLTGELEVAAPLLERTVNEARQSWTAFLPWPESLAAELDLQQGKVASAAERFGQAFALGCQLGDPCWEGLAGRGLARVAVARSQHDLARELLLDALRRCSRVPDSYLWGRVYTLDTLCELEASQGSAGADGHIDEMLQLAQRSGMHELTVRAHLHSAMRGRGAALAVAMELAKDVDNPALHRVVDAKALRLSS
ncbi:BTAD domain-containing putative transcriptional regulator [Hydrogenophaga sp.]|uniref:AfsR/SARP family transcriptional regulator n=1 Tax=Hydrogenophaga sp. TaxID=1904254 RepID=UPI003F6FDE66